MLLNLLKHPFGDHSFGNLLLAPSASDFKSRRSIIARHLDPMERINDRLGITRFLTTNYDFEVERYFEDNGYKRFDPHKVLQTEEVASDNPLQFRTNGFGAVLRDMTFDSKTATDLLAFAANSGGADASVFHLHGRATKQDGIVATEREYMNMYLRRDPDREVVDESILMAFAANTVFFLGLGMTEADVLRPLRQFMSDQDRAMGYRAIVLLPADQEYEARAKMSAGLYLRYGAHTMYYGSGRIRGKGGYIAIDWMHRIMRLIKFLEKKAKSRLEQSPKRGKFPTSDQIVQALDVLNRPLITATELTEELGTLGADLVKDDDPTSYPALPLMLGIRSEAWNALLDEIKVNDHDDPLEERHLRDVLTNKVLEDGHPLKDRIKDILRDGAAGESRLQVCEFTSQRRQNVEMSRVRRTTAHDAEPYVGFYVTQLDALLKIALQDLRGDAERKYKNVYEGQRSLNAIITGLTSLKDAIQTACLNCALDGLNLEWKQWWKDWQMMPPHRESRFEQLPGPAKPEDTSKPPGQGDWHEQNLSGTEKKLRDSILLPRRDVRHKVESIITDLRRLTEQTASEIDAGKLNHKKQIAFDPADVTGVRIFDRFIYDLHRMSKYRAHASGRISTTVDAHRGQGKGVFFSTLTTRLGLTSYIRAVRPETSDKHLHPAFVSAIFINFSFATEVASVYDMLLDSLERTITQMLVIAKTNTHTNCVPDGLTPLRALEQLFAVDDLSFVKVADHLQNFNKDVQKQRNKLSAKRESLSRHAKTRELLLRFRKAAKKVMFAEPFGLRIRPRLLICLNATELLFDAQRRPKNREIADYLDLLSSDEMRDVPFDLLSIGSMRGMGNMYHSDTRLTRKSFAWKELHSAQRATLHKRAEMLGFEITDPSDAKAHTAMVSMPGNFNFIHFARRTMATRFLVDNFPVFALSLLTARLTRADPSVSTADNSWIGRLDDKSIRNAYRDLQEKRDEAWKRFSPPDCNEDYLKTRSEFSFRILEAVFKAQSESGECTFRAFDGFDDVVLQDDVALEDVLDVPATVRKCAEGLYRDFTPAPGSQDEDDWNDLHGALSGNRFCLTILLAAAEQLVLAFPSFVTGGQEANQMLENVVSALRNSSVGQREETVMAAVMSVNRQLSQVGKPELDHDLHQLLLRNIAVLGCPVSPNVLVRLPDIRAYFNETISETGISRRRMVATALAALAERGLVFRITPHPKLVRLSEYADSYENLEKAGDHVTTAARDKQIQELQRVFKNWPAHVEYGYALHRQIQTFCFQRLGHLTAPPVTGNNFAPTLYASMPSRVIRLSNEGYLFLRRLLLSLSQYPDIRHEDAARIIPTFGQDDVITRVQALRAGLSVARTCFSIAAVSRFDKDMTGLDIIRKRGHFETCRVRLRWILRKAWEVHEPRIDPRTAEDADRRRVNALYEDEIVWLYNEVAVTCLVQGSVSEAIGHIRQAIYLNRRVEGPLDGGRMHNMLSLNCAIVQFERGRLKSAEDRLNQIVDSEGTEKYRVSNLAKGYLALIAQMRGRRHEAQTRLEKVVAKLEWENQDRSLAIMLHHLVRLQAQTDLPLAQEKMRRARAYAEKGGHEDIRYRILVSEVWMSQNYEPDSQDRMSEDRTKLRDAENYAQSMGLHALMVESLHAQGVILLKAGDYSSSGRMMTKAMAIARRNDMTLRQNTTMTNYAQVLLERRRVASAKRLLNAALTLAKRSGYSIEVGRIHAVMDRADRMSTEADVL